MLKALWLSLMMVAMAMAADVAGKWSGQVPSRGETSAATFVFKVDGNKLTGTMSGAQGEQQLQEGKVSGDQISFTTTAGDAKVAFQGTVSGHQIKMTRQREGGQSREFTLKREK